MTRQALHEPTADEAQRQADTWAARAEQYRGTPVARSCRVNAASWAKLAKVAKEARDGEK